VPWNSIRSFSTKCGSGVKGANAIQAAKAISNGRGILSSQVMVSLSEEYNWVYFHLYIRNSLYDGFF
jgi:hypothetical protein